MTQELNSYEVKLSDITDMQVANIDYSDVFQLQGEDEGSDWALLNAHATFSHKEACEFILYVGSEPETLVELLEHFGYSKVLIDYCKAAQSLGFKYVCFYA